MANQARAAPCAISSGCSIAACFIIALDDYRWRCVLVAERTLQCVNWRLRDSGGGSGPHTLQVSSQSSVGRMPLDVTANMPEFPVVLGNNVTLPGRLAIEGLDQSGVERVRFTRLTLLSLYLLGVKPEFCGPATGVRLQPKRG